MFEDHRSILIALYHARQKGIIDGENPPDLIRFDLHDDGKDPSSGLDPLLPFVDAEADLREFFDFVEWELSTMDDDWVKVAMELGLIRHVVTFGAEKTDNFSNGKSVYEDHREVEHQYWSLGHIWHELPYQGNLTDRAKLTQNSDLWEILQWKGDGFKHQKEPHPLVLDFDLDCFTDKIDDQRIAWPNDILRSRFCDYDPGSEACITPKAFVSTLMQKSQFVTLCLESVCCGGLGEATRILETLDAIFWDSTLFPRPEFDLR